MKTLLATAAIGLIGTSAFAQSLYTTTGSATNQGAFGDIGINFTVTSSVDVTSLSFFGVSLSGGDTPSVQLWNVDTSTVIASVAWDAGTATAGWNTISLDSNVTLTAGTNYQLQAIAYWAPVYDSASSFTYSSVVGSTSYSQTRAWYNWAPLDAPSSGATTDYAAIANLTFSSVPEPSSFALIGGCLALGCALTRRRNS
jgi:hypothetical protein